MALLLVATLVCGLAFALAVPAGLPYDEPSHWATVRFIAEHWRLPVMGEPGVTYEAQQTPLYYLMAAPISQLPMGFLAVRMFGVVGHVIVTGLTWLTIRRAVPGAPEVALAGAASMGLNPMLLAIGASVQNDTWSLVWGIGAIVAALHAHGRPRVWGSVAVGGLAGLAILTKLSMAPVGIGICVSLLVLREYRSVLWTGLTTTTVTAWWFVRNLILYGDLTGQSGVSRTGVAFPYTEPSLTYLAQSVLTYLILPTEYVRNVIASPPWVDLLALAFGAAIAVGAVVLVLRVAKTANGTGLLLVFVVALASFAAWLIQVLLVQPVAFRTAYGVLPLVALSVGCVTAVSSRAWTYRGLVALVVGLQLVISLWFLTAVSGQNPLLIP